MTDFGLFELCKQGKTDAIRALLANGNGNGAVNSLDENRWTPLHLMAATSGNLDIVKILLDAKADVTMTTESGIQTGWSALHWAADKGFVRVCDVLVQYNANINLQDDKGRPPLQIASASGQRDVVQLLLQRRANINATNSRNRTALHFATMAGHRDVVSCLVENGAAVDIKGKDGKTPLDLASPEIKQIMLNRSSSNNNNNAAPVDSSAAGVGGSTPARSRNPEERFTSRKKSLAPSNVQKQAQQMQLGTMSATLQQQCGVGISLELQESTGQIVVQRLNGSAARALAAAERRNQSHLSTRVGDVVLTIDGQDVRDKGMNDCQRLITGDEDSIVQFKVQSTGQEPRNVSLIRLTDDSVLDDYFAQVAIRERLMYYKAAATGQFVIAANDENRKKVALLEKQLLNRERQIDTLKQQLHEAVESASVARAASGAQLEEERKTLEKEMMILRKDNREMEDTVAKLQDQISTLEDSLDYERQSKEEADRSAKEKIDDLQAKVKNFQVQVGALTKTSSALEELSSAFQKAQNENDVMSKKLREYERSLQNHHQLEMDMLAMSKKYETEKQNNRQIAAQNQALMAAEAALTEENKKLHQSIDSSDWGIREKELLFKLKSCESRNAELSASVHASDRRTQIAISQMDNAQKHADAIKAVNEREIHNLKALLVASEQKVAEMLSAQTDSYNPHEIRAQVLQQRLHDVWGEVTNAKIEAASANATASITAALATTSWQGPILHENASKWQSALNAKEQAIEEVQRKIAEIAAVSVKGSVMLTSSLQAERQMYHQRLAVTQEQLKAKEEELRQSRFGSGDVQLPLNGDAAMLVYIKELSDLLITEMRHRTELEEANRKLKGFVQFIQQQED